MPVIGGLVSGAGSTSWHCYISQRVVYEGMLLPVRGPVLHRRTRKHLLLIHDTVFIQCGIHRRRSALVVDCRIPVRSTNKPW